MALRSPVVKREMAYENLSYWFDSLGSPVCPRPFLPGDIEADVAIVGAGFTGLWTAYYLSRLDPSLRVVVVEREVAGFGASGRNGGWCSALFAASPARLARMFGTEQMHAMGHAMRDTVDEVGRVANAEGIECSFRKEGTIDVARSQAQLHALRAELEESRHLGIGEDHLAWYGATEARGMLAASGVLGGLFTPDCASIHPARLVRGLAEAVERNGVQVYEQCEVLEVVPG
ncbi:MAG: NAD(P)/FAD-dependent oxidoreductase, partial [Acidimicrobiales bacterium]